MPLNEHCRVVIDQLLWFEYMNKNMPASSYATLDVIFLYTPCRERITSHY